LFFEKLKRIDLEGRIGKYFSQAKIL